MFVLRTTSKASSNNYTTDVGCGGPFLCPLTNHRDCLLRTDLTMGFNRIWWEVEVASYKSTEREFRLSQGLFSVFLHIISQQIYWLIYRWLFIHVLIEKGLNKVCKKPIRQTPSVSHWHLPHVIQSFKLTWLLLRLWEETIAGSRTACKLHTKWTELSNFNDEAVKCVFSCF